MNKSILTRRGVMSAAFQSPYGDGFFVTRRTEEVCPPPQEAVSIPLRRWLLCNGRCSLLASPYSLKNLLWKPPLSHPSKSFIGRKSHFLSPSSQEAFQNQVKASCPQLRLSNTTFFQICQTFLQSRGKIGKGYEKPRETRPRSSVEI
jgi:hypothetical protein